MPSAPRPCCCSTTCQIAYYTKFLTLTDVQHIRFYECRMLHLPSTLIGQPSMLRLERYRRQSAGAVDAHSVNLLVSKHGPGDALSMQLSSQDRALAAQCTGIASQVAGLTTAAHGPRAQPMRSCCCPPPGWYKLFGLHVHRYKSCSGSNVWYPPRGGRAALPAGVARRCAVVEVHVARREARLHLLHPAQKDS